MRGLIPFWPPARLDFFIVPSLGGGSGIMNHGYKKCKNHGSQVCFKNLGIMNLFTSARESWITRLWEKLNKMHIWINCVRARECGIWRFRDSNFQKCFRGSKPPDHPYIIRAFGADSPLVSPVTLVLNVQFQKKKNSTPGQKGWLYRAWMKTEQLTEVWTPKKLYKTRLSCHWDWIIKSIGDQKSSWIMNLEEKFCRNHESLRQKRQESWISRFKRFRFYSRS